MDMMKYRLSIQLYKIYNGHIINDDWIDMNVLQNFNARMNCVQINDRSNLRIGKNIMANRLGIKLMRIELSNRECTFLRLFTIKKRRL